jgi:hypothetical protein
MVNQGRAFPKGVFGMTRREEIEQQASLTVFPWDDVREQSKFEDGFIEGANWADKTMINKAIQWLFANVYDYLNPEDQERVASFRKYMEE